MIVPTIGRQVWFHNSLDAVHAANYQPEAATVVYVHNERTVNLQVLDHNGNARSETSVPLVQGDEIQPQTGKYAEWMPYQKGQAAKTDALASGFHNLGPATDA